MNKLHTLLCCAGACALLASCSWNTYVKEDGTTGLRPTNQFGQAVYYEDGTYSSNQRYNEYRPIRRVLEPAAAPSEDRVTWK